MTQDLVDISSGFTCIFLLITLRREGSALDHCSWCMLGRRAHPSGGHPSVVMIIHGFYRYYISD